PPPALEPALREAAGEVDATASVPVSPKTCRQPRACTPRGAGRGISGGRWLVKQESAVARRRVPVPATPPVHPCLQRHARLRGSGRPCAIHGGRMPHSNEPHDAVAITPARPPPADAASSRMPAPAPAVDGDDAIPPPKADATAGATAATADEHVGTWITKEA